MAQEKKNTFLGGMATMGLALILVKIIGAIYKIPIGRYLEDNYASFSNAYDIYTVLINISITGFPVALSKMVAASHALGRERQVQKTFHLALAIFLSLGLVSFLIMFFGADALAARMNDTYAAQAIRYLAPAVICVSCVGSFRGFFQGHSNMRPSAASQVIEALGKLCIGLPLAMLMVRLGRKEEAPAYAILGVTLGSAVALAYMIVCYARRPFYEDLSDEGVDGAGKILKELLVIAIPVTLTASAVSIINTIDAAVVQGQLQHALGMAEKASRALYSDYGRAKNIYNLPASFMMAVTVTVIPAVSSALAVGRKGEASRLVKAAYHITALLVFPMGVGMSVLAEPIVRLLYGPKDAELTGRLLSILGVAAIFVCMVTVSNSVLQAYGRQNLPVLVMVCAGLVMLAVDYILVGTPAVGIFGSPIGTLCCFALAAVVDFAIIHRLMAKPPNYLRLFFGPALATAAMGVAAWGGYRLACLAVGGVQITVGSRALAVGNALSVLIAILLAVAVYVFLVVFLQLLSRDELKLMPKGDKIADLLRLP